MPAAYKQAVVQYSSNIFLAEQLAHPTLLLQIKNETSPQFSEVLQRKFYEVCKKNGFKLVDDPIDAELLIQINIVYSGTKQAAELPSLLAAGFGTIVNSDIITPANVNLKDEPKLYVLLADLQLSLRVADSKSAAGTGNVPQTRRLQSWRQYQTRIAISKTPLTGHDFNSTAKWLFDKLPDAVLGILQQ
jgi:hypothetical protein